MSQQAEIKSIDNIRQFQTFLSQYSSSINQSTEQANRDLSLAEKHILTRLTHWKSEKKQREMELRKAEEQLRRCQRSTRESTNTYQHPHPCAQYDRMVTESLKRLKAVEEKLKLAKQSKKLLDYCKTDLSCIKSKCNHLINEVDKTKSKLGRIVHLLENYINQVGGKGTAFENKAQAYLFFDSQPRLRIYRDDNPHLEEYDSRGTDGISNKEYRESDAYISERGELWDFKSGYEKGGVDADQYYDYSAMEDAGSVNCRVKDTSGEEKLINKNITSINYLFDSHEGAEANFRDLDGFASVFFFDSDNNLRRFKG